MIKALTVDLLKDWNNDKSSLGSNNTEDRNHSDLIYYTNKHSAVKLISVQSDDMNEPHSW